MCTNTHSVFKGKLKNIYWCNDFSGHIFDHYIFPLAESNIGMIFSTEKNYNNSKGTGNTIAKASADLSEDDHKTSGTSDIIFSTA